MRTMNKVVSLLLVVTVVIGISVQAQDLQEQLKKLSRDAAIGYVTPFLNHFAANLNSGFYHSADLHDILGFDVGVKISLTRVRDEDKTFKLTLPPTISVRAADLDPALPANQAVVFYAGTDYDPNLTPNTAFGSKNPTPVTLRANKTVTVGGITRTIAANRTILEIPGGFDIPTLPLVVPQVAVGLPLGLEVIGRYAPPLKVGDAGKFSYFGFGLRYDIDQWLPAFPIDIAAHFATQKLSFKSSADKDIFSAKGIAYGLEASKKLFILTVYAGFQLEKATVSLGDYDYIDPATGQTITVQGFDVTGDNKSRFNVGLRLLLLILNVHAEYSFAKIPVATVGVGISLR
ncbi:MAG: hypothetical protein N3A63_09155 [Bacteroidetes bacterium]|nr:hypothetical protein [Bacteroidota bacterium]